MRVWLGTGGSNCRWGPGLGDWTVVVVKGGKIRIRLWSREGNWTAGVRVVQCWRVD